LRDGGSLVKVVSMRDEKRNRPLAGAARAAAPGARGDQRECPAGGAVRIGPRYAMLEADDGAIWRLRSEDDLRAFEDRREVLEGRVVSADETVILWIGAEDVGEAKEPE
jgi:hypothetical protein